MVRAEYELSGLHRAVTLSTVSIFGIFDQALQTKINIFTRLMKLSLLEGK